MRERYLVAGGIVYLAAGHVLICEARQLTPYLRATQKKFPCAKQIACSSWSI